jgi:pyruvate formate lyase activating enzyme
MSHRPLPVLAPRAPRDAADPRPLLARLADFARPATLFEPTEHGAVRCTACAHGCVLTEGREGACGVRFLRDGTLMAPHGYVARRYVRSVESNTLYHFHPGARAFILGMFGCDLRCPYCHNWRISQALREDVQDEAPLACTAEELAAQAVAEGCTVMAAAYNEPMISAEWIREVFSAAKARGLATAIVSDANTTRAALEHVRPVCDAFRVDLKGTDNERYKALGGRIAPVLDAIRTAHELGFWVEVVTMVVPGFNDELHGLRALAEQIARVSVDIPWHLNAFVPRYKLSQHPRMEMGPLASAVGMGYARGLRFVYASNAPGGYSELSHTRCPGCHEVLLERNDYRLTRGHLTEAGACPRCGEAIPGRWSHGRAAEGVGHGDAELP